MPFRKCGVFILIEAFKSRLRCLHKLQVLNSSKDNQRTCDWKLQENMSFFSCKERNLWVHTCIDGSRARKQTVTFCTLILAERYRNYWSQAQSRKQRITSSDLQLRKAEDRLFYHACLELGHGLARADVNLGMAIKRNEIGYQCCDEQWEVWCLFQKHRQM